MCVLQLEHYFETGDSWQQLLVVYFKLSAIGPVFIPVR